MKKKWCFATTKNENDKIPIEMFTEIKQKVEIFAKSRVWYSRRQLQTRFKNQFCYLDLVEQDGSLSPICRLRYHKQLGWSMAIYTWSNERYQPCVFGSGEFGTIENAIEACEFLYLN